MPLVINIEIPFEIAISGGFQEVQYTRSIKCESCKNGKNKTSCLKCNGSGKRKYGVQASDRELPCTHCTGTGFVLSGICNVCNGKSVKNTLAKINIKINPGTINGTKITLNGNGNNIIDNLYGDLVVVINVKASSEGLTLSGSDVISVVELTLLEALKGTKKSLRTIKGDKVLEFKPKIKNGDKIRVSGFGVPPNGAHIFTVSVVYPEDVSNLISVLDGYEKFS
jgi:molecular chaperone DnaJ